MLKKITNISIIVGLIAGFPGVIDAVTPANVRNVQHSRAARKWQKKIDKIRKTNAAEYLQTSNNIRLEIQRLMAADCGLLLGANVLNKVLHPLVVTLENHST